MAKAQRLTAKLLFDDYVIYPYSTKGVTRLKLGLLTIIKVFFFRLQISNEIDEFIKVDLSIVVNVDNCNKVVQQSIR